MRASASVHLAPDAPPHPAAPPHRGGGAPRASRHPLGNPKAECGFFGLTPLLDSEGSPIKDDGQNSTSQAASVSAAFAIVKDGRGSCGTGEQSYRTYANVTAGQTLFTPTGGGNISHITYCACPVQ